MANLAQQTDRLVLSAFELKTLGWPDWLVEDYLNILRDYVRTSNAIDENTGDSGDLMVEVNIGNAQSLSSTTKAIDSLSTEAVTSVSKQTDTDVVNPVASSFNRLKVKKLSSDVSVIGTATISNIQTNSATVNTNTPSGATAYALELKDSSGVTLGYLPIYGSLW